MSGIPFEFARPAPWRVACYPSKTDPVWDVVYGPDDPSEEFSVLESLTRDDAMLIAWARGAEDVMMRRGWYAARTLSWPNPNKWYLEMPGIEYSVWSAYMDTIAGGCDHPFIALVEADQWYIRNVESKKEI